MVAWVIYLVGLAIAAAAASALVGPITILVLRAAGPGRAALASLVEGYGRLVAFLIGLSAGTGATLVVCMLVGVGARAFDDEDWRFFYWVSGQQSHGLTQLMKILTQIGGTLEMRITAVVVGVILVALKPRFAWVTVLALFSVMALQFELAQILGLAIHRGHPPVGFGTYPSGGVSRLVALPGVVLLLVTRYWRPVNPWLVRAGWGLVALLGWTELYSRVYLGKHFVSDSVGGAVFGVMLIITVGLAVAAAMLDRVTAARTSPAQPRSLAVPPAGN